MNVLKGYLKFLEQADNNIVYTLGIILNNGVVTEDKEKMLEFLLLDYTNKKIDELKSETSNFKKLKRLNNEQEMIYKEFLNKADQRIIEIIYKGITLNKGMYSDLMNKLLSNAERIYKKRFNKELNIKDLVPKKEKEKEKQKIKPKIRVIHGDMNDFRKFLKKFFKDRTDE